MKYAVALLLAGLAAAIPVQKRGVSTVVVVETVYQTSTKWVDANAAEYTPSSYTSSTTTISASASTSTTATVTPTTTSTFVSASTSTTSSVVVPTPTTTSSSTSVYVAQTTSSTTSAYVAPTTSTTTPAAVATPPAVSYGSGSGTTYTGDITYYTPGVGSCGWTNTSSDSIVAISVSLMDTKSNGNPNTNPWCGTKIMISYNGVETPATIVDTCMGCEIEGSLDLTESLFKAVAPNGDGRVHGVSWRVVG